MSTLMAFDACAQWSPGGMMAYVGDLNLAGTKASSGVAPYVIGGFHTSQASQALQNNSSINGSAMDNVSTGGDVLKPLDLSNYSGDRMRRSLAGYKNIMYPIAESAGFTATTAAGSTGGGCGCG